MKPQKEQKIHFCFNNKTKLLNFFVSFYFKSFVSQFCECLIDLSIKKKIYEKYHKHAPNITRRL